MRPYYNCTILEKNEQRGKMNEDKKKKENRKFIKMVGIRQKREIERKVQNAIADGTLTGSEHLAVKMTLELPDLDIKQEFDDSIYLG